MSKPEKSESNKSNSGKITTAQLLDLFKILGIIVAAGVSLYQIIKEVKSIDLKSKETELLIANSNLKTEEKKLEGQKVEYAIGVNQRKIDSLNLKAQESINQLRIREFEIRIAELEIQKRLFRLDSNKFKLEYQEKTQELIQDLLFSMAKNNETGMEGIIQISLLENLIEDNPDHSGAILKALINKLKSYPSEIQIRTITNTIVPFGDRLAQDDKDELAQLNLLVKSLISLYLYQQWAFITEFDPNKFKSATEDPDSRKSQKLFYEVSNSLKAFLSDKDLVESLNRGYDYDIVEYEPRSWRSHSIIRPNQEYYGSIRISDLVEVNIPNEDAEQKLITEEVLYLSYLSNHLNMLLESIDTPYLVQFDYRVLTNSGHLTIGFKKK